MVKVCPDCHKTFSTTFCVNRHQRCAHRGERPFQCEHCSQSFGYKHVLLHHIDKKHSLHIVSQQVHSAAQQWTMDIPRLTHMISQFHDPGVYPSVHISQVCLFTGTTERTVLPGIMNSEAQQMDLPRFGDVCGVMRANWGQRL